MRQATEAEEREILALIDYFEPVQVIHSCVQGCGRQVAVAQEPCLKCRNSSRQTLAPAGAGNCSNPGDLGESEDSVGSSLPEC
jgi:hypothetical protein